MEFLKALFGENSLTYEQLVQAIETFNGDPANKDKLIKIANLSEGGYVSKGKYAGLETELAGKVSELDKANTLISELQKTAGKDEDLQGKITQYETDIADLQAENEKLKTENALKFAIAEAGGSDVDYLLFKAMEKGDVKLDTNGKIKGADALIEDLKTQHPAMFESATPANPDRRVLENNLPNGAQKRTVTKEQFAVMGYAERLKLKQENPELFKQLNG